MNKTELVNAITEIVPGSTKAQTDKFLSALIKACTDELSSNGNIVLPGFGSLSVGVRSARTGRNPQTGQEIQIPASKTVRFKAGVSLKKAIQEA